MLGIEKKTNDMLKEISDARKGNNELVNSMKDIVAQAVAIIHRREIK